MEDFQSAYMERHKDFSALDTAKRRTAAMHFGGITIECLLKTIIKDSLPTNADGEKEWKNETNNPGHTCYNPGHNYDAAIRLHNKLKARIEHVPYVRKWLNDVENYGCHFINMRYVGDEPDDEKYKKWKQSYTSLRAWLQKQATQL